MKNTKKLITVATLVLAMFASFAYVTPANAEETAKKQVVTTPGVITTNYFNLTIPEQYKDKFVAEVTDDDVVLYSKKCYDWSDGKYSEGDHAGVVFWFSMTPYEEFFGGYKIFKKVGSMLFASAEPTDVQYPLPDEDKKLDAAETAQIEEAKNEYDELFKLGPDLIGNSFEPLVTAPGDVTLKSAKNVKGKKIKVSYEGKTDDILKYEVQIGQKSYGEWYWDGKTTTKSTITLSKSIGEKLKKNKTYKVRVRSIGKKGDLLIYGKWSKAKSIKIKK